MKKVILTILCALQLYSAQAEITDIFPLGNIFTQQNIYCQPPRDAAENSKSRKFIFRKLRLIKSE